MSDEGLDNFFWIALFLVTGFSFFVFSKMLKFLTGTNLPVFTWIAIIALLVGTLISIRKIINKSEK